MKILQLVTQRQYRGAEVFAATLSRELIASGQQIIFAGLYSPPPQPLTVEGAVNIDIHADKNSFLSVSGVKKLAALISKEKPDVIQANGSDTLKYALASRLISGYRPIVYRNISIISTWVGNSVLKKSFYKWLFRRVDHVSSVGHESRSDFKKFFDYPDEKITVIRRGIGGKMIVRDGVRRGLERSFSINHDDKIVVHIGNFSAEKNHKFLLKVFSKLKDTNPEIKLILVGEGELFEEIRNEIITSLLQHTVSIAGFRSDVENVLGGADLFVLCSLVEGVPGVILEAASYCVPSLAVNVGGIGEVVKNNETGVLLPDHNIDAFASELVKMLSDGAGLVRMGEKAFHFVKEEFDPSRNAAKFIDMYQKLVDKSRGKN